MAAIDKIYVDNYEQYMLFKRWCEEQPPLKDKYGKEVELSSYLYECTNECEWKGGRPIFSAPYYVDAYVIKHCPFDFIQKELMINYGHWSQDKINEAYDIVTNRTEKNKDFFTWLTEDDFKIVDGVITMPNLEKSDYQRIKDGELYTSPSVERNYGKHFKCVKHPINMYNKPFKCKSYWVSVELEDRSNGFMWYHEDTDTWDYSVEFVESKWTSSHAHCKTIKALHRKIIKWKLPIGARVKVTGRYTFDDYEFVVKK